MSSGGDEKMVSAGAILGMVFSLFCSLVLPLVLVIYLYKRYQISIKAVLIGGLVFFVTQILLRVPLISFFGSRGWFQLIPFQPLLPSLILALSAGLFEETGRYYGFRLFLKDKLRWKDGIAFGLGHGGLEAILLVGVSHLQLLAFSIMINMNKFEQIIGSALPEGGTSIKELLTGGNFFSFAVGGIERLFALTVHIAFSLIILLAIVKKRPIYILYAILLHGLVDIPAAYVQLAHFPIWSAELLFFVISIIAVIFIYKARKRFE
jgi:uncharacterized membrane protein YhfC